VACWALHKSALNVSKRHQQSGEENRSATIPNSVIEAHLGGASTFGKRIQQACAGPGRPDFVDRLQLVLLCERFYITSLKRVEETRSGERQSSP
jgi:hypothetical protein